MEREREDLFVRIVYCVNRNGVIVIRILGS